MYNGHWFGGGFMWLFWIVLILVIIWVIKMVTSAVNTPADKQKSALDILQERYAKGEIDQKEFEEKKKVLSNKL